MTLQVIFNDELCTYERGRVDERWSDWVRRTVEGKWEMQQNGATSVSCRIPDHEETGILGWISKLLEVSGRDRSGWIRWPQVFPRRTSHPPFQQTIFNVIPTERSTIDVVWRKGQM